MLSNLLKFKKSINYELNWDDCNKKTNGELCLINTYAENWKIIFDVGANKGSYAQEVLIRQSKCKIFCFEPIPDMVKIIKSSGIKDVYQYAVHDKMGKVTFNVNLKFNSQSSIYRNNSFTTKISVPTITLDYFMDDKKLSYVDFIKIDTEGNEIYVLKGMSRIISENRVGMIQFEYGGTYLDSNTTLKDAYMLLKDNYIVCHLMPNGLLPLQYSEKIETYRYSNWIAVSRNIFAKIL